MRAVEFLKEQGTIGTIGSTTGAPTTLPQVSQTSPVKTASTSTNQQPDQNKLNFVKLVSPHGIKEPEDIDTAIGALQAVQMKKDPTPDQLAVLGKLAGPLMSNPGLAASIKAMSMQKPGVQK
jgi:hypothetical protein